MAALLRYVITSFIGLLLFASDVSADQAGKITGTIPFFLYNEYLNQPEGQPEELNLVYWEIFPEIDLYASDNVFVHFLGDVELTKQPTSGFFHLFEGQGAFVEELSLNYTDDDISFFIGKFDPNVISDFPRTPDLYITSLNQDELEITERLGFGGYLPIKSTEYGTHRIYASVFRQDTTFLSESWINNRGRNSLSDGGPSNTSGLESFYIGSYGGDIAGFKDLKYHVGFSRQVADIALGGPTAKVGNEYRITGALQQEFKIDDDLSITPLLEYYHFWNADGNAGETRDYVTTAATFNYGSWNLGLAYTGRFVSGNTAFNDDEQFFQVLGGYEFPYEINLELAYLKLLTTGANEYAVLAVLSRSFSF